LQKSSIEKKEFQVHFSRSSFGLFVFVPISPRHMILEEDGRKVEERGGRESACLQENSGQMLHSRLINIFLFPNKSPIELSLAVEEKLAGS